MNKPRPIGLTSRAFVGSSGRKMGMRAVVVLKPEGEADSEGSARGRWKRILKTLLELLGVFF